MIDHAMLDAYEAVNGEFERLPAGHAFGESDWEALDGLMLDLHLLRHGYATEGYERHIDRELQRLCSGPEVAERIKRMRL
jgi:hypothetical protein